MRSMHTHLLVFEPPLTYKKMYEKQRYAVLLSSLNYITLKHSSQK